jgi:hypothetical protein
MFHLGSTSEKNLQGVHPDLVKVVRRAIELTEVDFRVGEGLRSLAQQKKNVAKGVSWTLKSRHLTGHAVDLLALIDGKVTWSWAPYYKIAAAMKQAAGELRVPIVWGGDWKKTKDGPHFELDRKEYP